MSKFSDLLSNLVAKRRYLVIVEAYDLDNEQLVTRYFSDHGFVSEPDDEPANTYFEPRVISALNFERQLFSRGTLGGASTTGFGQIELNNADGGLDDLAGYAFDGRRVQVLLGSDGFGLVEYGSIFEGTAEEIEFSDSTLSIRIRDLQYRLDTDVDRESYGGTGGLDGREGLKDRPKPLCFGRVFHAPAILVDPVQRIYQVHDGPVDEIVAVYDRGVALTKVVSSPIGGQFAEDLSNGTFTLGSSASGEVSADVRGDATAGLYVETAGAILKRIAVQYGGFSDPEDLDTASFDAAEISMPQPVGIYIADDVSLSQIFDDLVNATGGYYGFTREGALQIGLVTSAKVTAHHEVDSAQILELERHSSQRPIWKQKIGYARYWQTLSASAVAGSVGEEERANLAEEFRYASSEDESIKTAFLLADELTLDTGLALAADAEAEAQRRFNLFGTRRELFNVVLKTQPFSMNLGETVKLTYHRYGLQAGKNFVIVGMVEDASVNQVTLDLWG